MLLLKFQSTRPRGARQIAIIAACIKSCFNPRAHAGRDNGKHYLTKTRIVSIHAPTRGATAGESMPITKQLVSIHAPTRGATKNMDYKDKQEIVSIHAPTRGATILNLIILLNMGFQSTRPRGARPE